MKSRAGIAAAAVLLCACTARAQDAALTQPYSEADCPPCAEWNEPSRPIHLFGNTYYVGTRGLASVLIASPAGHVLIDGGLPDTAPLILRNIEALGFDPADVEIILNSHEHYDHAGGLAVLQQATGARVLASPASAPVLRSGRSAPDDPQHDVALPMPPVARVDIVQAGEVVRVGPLALTMHPTGGHTPGGTTWSWRSCEGERCLDFVYADSQTPISQDGFRFTDHPEAVAAFRAGHARLEQLPCDILITPHPGASRMWERLAGGQDGLVDSTACRSYAANARQQLERRLERERQ